MRRVWMQGIRAISIAVAGVALALPAAAELPDAVTLLTDLGFSQDQIAQVMRGDIVRGAIEPASDRELVAAMAFQVDLTPEQIVAQVEQGRGNEVDPDTIASGEIEGTPDAADFAKLGFGSDAAKRAREWLEAEPGGSLNLSSDEIARFQKLATTDPPPATVAAAVRSALADRVRAYQQKGLDGIAPYALSGGKQRSPAEELRTATQATKTLKRFVPHAHQLLNAYPAGKPEGTEERYRWTHFSAHGTPTLSLQHLLIVPEGDARVIAQRMFYVSSGFNAEQAVAALIPVEGGTVIVYGNRTSTDQIAGFGGSAKRSIGSKLLESQLEAVFERTRASAGP